MNSLRAIVRQFNPDCLLLTETMTTHVQLPLRRVGFHHFVDCPPLGKKGGLVFAWRPGLDFDILCVHKNYVNLLIFSDPIVNQSMDAYFCLWSCSVES